MDNKIDFFFGSCFGIVTGVSVFLWIFMHVDNNYNNSADRHVRIYQKCQEINSTPLSFDMDTITCKNGVKIEYTFTRK